MKIKRLFSRRFYLTLFYRLRAAEIRTLLFLDAKILLVFLIVFFLNLVFFFPGKIQIAVPKVQVQVSIIENLIRIISIFLGILFSFIVLSFNVFYKYFGRFTFQSFFKLDSIRRLFTLLISALTFLLYAFSYLREISQRHVYSDSLFLLSIVISVIATLSIIPTIIKLLRQSQNREHIKSLIASLNVDWVLSYYKYIRWSDKKEKHYERDPITLLTEIGIPAVKESDFTTSSLIIDGSVDHFEKVVSEYKPDVSPRDLYWELTRLFLNLYQVAVKERNENAMFNTISARLRLENIVIENLEKVELWQKPGKYDGSNFRNEIRDYFNRAVQFNEDGASQRVIDNYRDFGKRLIEDILPGRFNYDPDDRTKDIDEQFVVHSYVDALNYILSVMATSKKFHLYRNISNLFYTLDVVTASSKNTFDSKRFILHVLDYTKYASFEQYLRNSATKTIEWLDFPYHLSPGTVLEDAGITIPFHGLLKSTNLLLTHGLLNNVTINCMKSDALHLIQNFDKTSTYKDLLLLIVDKFAELRDVISEDDSDYRKDTYIKLSMYLGYIESHAKAKLSDVDTLSRIAEVQKGFKWREKFKDELRRKGHIFDDRIA